MHLTAFAANESELPEKGRLEVWISAADHLELPPATFEENDCLAMTSAVDKKACLNWLNTQVVFRTRIKELFTRMWRIAPNASVETYALPVFDALTDFQREALGFPRPASVPLRKFQVAPDGLTRFEILIPWELFPPFGKVNLGQLQFRVDLIGGSNTISSVMNLSYTGRGERPTLPLPAVAVSPPINTRITPCDQPPVARTVQGEDKAAFFFLTNNLSVDKVFIFDDYMCPGYAPDFKTHASPVTWWKTFFFQELDRGEFLCGPFMSYRKENIVRHFPLRLEPSMDMVSVKPITKFPVKRLANGTRLILYSPDAGHGPLWKKNMVFYETKIIALTPSLEAVEALNLGPASSYDLTGYEVEISDDWKNVTEFRSKEFEKWTSETFCLVGSKYKSCGTNADSHPPKKLVQHH